MQILKDEIRDRILDVSENMFYQKGFKDTTTRNIAEAVGISVSNLYLYYENKEALFNGVVDGFYRYFMNGFNSFLEHQDKDHNMDMQISSYIKNIIAADHNKFVILADKSAGTKYEDFKEQMIHILTHHIDSQVNKNLVQDELIMYILATNFINGIIEIAKNYKDQRWLNDQINILVEYHMSGMKKLM